MIGIVDYTLGNVKAFANVYKELGIPFIIASKPEDLRKVSHVILPGVGAFDQAMQRLQGSGMREPLDEIALQRRLPVLGICVGMQMLAASSEEGVSPGLRWIEADVIRFRQRPGGRAMQIPHMGWNDVTPLSGGNLFRGLEDGARFYFLHSYYTRCGKGENVLAVARYGGEFTCAVKQGNVYGVQFHPEKSHRWGVQMLKNFAELKSDAAA